MTETTMSADVEHRQVLDVRAAVIAGLVAGLLFLLLELLVSAFYINGSPWVYSRYAASLVLGQGVLPPPPTFELPSALLGLAVHMLLSVVYALVLAFIVHRGGLLMGIVGGALFGLALFAINYYSFSFFFPWFFPVRSWIVIAAHVLFGASAGGIYEALERDRYIAVYKPTGVEGGVR